ncbi:MAG: hypothetical protein KDA89_24065, partial [Planctomycetaceae bacterium]|nr:hypothetical protein [Planctomycetaceae bacterium]
MKTHRIMLIGLALLTVTTGCSKFRGLTRRDYAALEDPFADGTAPPDKESPTNVPPTSEAAGVARLGSSATRTASSTGQTPATTARMSAGLAANPSRPETGIPKNSPRTNPAFNESDFTPPGDLTAGLPKAPDSALSDGPGPKAKMAGIASFLEDQAKNSGMTDTANELDKDFAAWAADQKEEWNHPTTAVPSNTPPEFSQLPSLPHELRGAKRAATPAVRATLSGPQESSFAGTAAIPTTTADQATPLIRQTAAAVEATVGGTAATTGAVENVSSAKSRSAGRHNPFAAFESPAASNGQRSAESAVPAAASPPAIRATVGTANPFADFETQRRVPSLSANANSANAN